MTVKVKAQRVDGVAISIVNYGTRSGGETWFIKVGERLIGAIEWRWIADNDGGLFSRNRRASDVIVQLSIVNPLKADKRTETVAGKSDKYDKAAKIGRAYLRAHRNEMITRIVAAYKAESGAA